MRFWKLQAGATALVAFGVFLMLGGGDRSDGAAVATRVLGLFIASVGAFNSIVVTLRLRREATPPRTTVTDLEGETATFLPRSALGVVGGGLMGLLLTELLGGWAAVAYTHGSPGWAVALLAPGLWFALPTLWLVTGRWVVGGVWLTPTRIVHKGFGLHTWTRWDDVTDVSVGEIRSIGVHSRNPGGRCLAPVMRNGKLLDNGLLAMNLLDLSLTFDKTLALMHTYWDHPELRAELGTPRSLQRIEQIWPTSKV